WPSRCGRLRQGAGRTQEMPAERAGLSVATIGALEEGQRRRPHPHTLAALADALGLSYDERAGLLEAASGSTEPQAQRSPQLVWGGQWSTDQDPTPRLAARAAPAARVVRLPVPPTALIGRESEVEACAAALDPNRSVRRPLPLPRPGGGGQA